MATFDPNVPQTGHNPQMDYGQMQQNYATINTSYNTDHVALNSSVNQGFHDKSTYLEQMSDPGAVANTGIVYTLKTNGNSELWMRKEGGQLIELSLIKAFVLFTASSVTPTPFDPTDSFNIKKVADGGGITIVTFSTIKYYKVPFRFPVSSVNYYGVPNDQTGINTINEFYIRFTTNGSATYGNIILQT